MIDKYDKYLAVQWDDMFGTSPIVYKSGYSVITLDKRGTEKITCAPPKKNNFKNSIPIYTIKETTSSTEGLSSIKSVLRVSNNFPKTVMFRFYTSQTLQTLQYDMNFYTSAGKDYNYPYRYYNPTTFFHGGKDCYYIFTIDSNLNTKEYIYFYDTGTIYTSKINWSEQKDANGNGISLEEAKTKVNTISCSLTNTFGEGSYGVGNFRIYETLIPESDIYDMLYRKTIISNDNKMRNIYYSEGASATSLSQVDGTCFVKGELIEQDGKVSINKNGNIYASEFIEF